jgi:hypothetical protein
MGIMAGLGPQWAKLYEKRKERNYKATERRQDWMDTYGIKGLNDMKDLASKSSIYLANLKGAGFTDEALQGLYADGDIEAIANMWSDVKKNNPTASQLAKIIAQAEELSTDESGGDLYSQIRKGLGLYKSGQSNDDIQENMFANALGYGGPRDPDGFEGYSYKDLRRISTGRTRRETGGMAANIRVPKKEDYSPEDNTRTATSFTNSFYQNLSALGPNVDSIITDNDATLSDRDRTILNDYSAKIKRLTNEKNKSVTFQQRIAGLTSIFNDDIFNRVQVSGDSTIPTIDTFYESIEDMVYLNNLEQTDNPANRFTFLPRTTRSAFNAWFKNKQSR